MNLAKKQDYCIFNRDHMLSGLDVASQLDVIDAKCRAQLACRAFESSIIIAARSKALLFTIILQA